MIYGISQKKFSNYLNGGIKQNFSRHSLVGNDEYCHANVNSSLPAKSLLTVVVPQPVDTAGYRQ